MAVLSCRMPSERRALLLLLGLAVAGQGVRYLVTRPGEAPGDVHILDDGPDRSPRAQAHAAVAALEPLKPGERIDADRAPAQALARLPRVGLSLAKRLGVDEKEVRRLLDPHYGSKLPRIAQAISLLGQRLVIDLEPV